MEGCGWWVRRHWARERAVLEFHEYEVESDWRMWVEQSLEREAGRWCCDDEVEEGEMTRAEMVRMRPRNERRVERMGEGIVEDEWFLSPAPRRGCCGLTELPAAKVVFVAAGMTPVVE